jgi:hypothetical protein
MLFEILGIVALIEEKYIILINASGNYRARISSNVFPMPLFRFGFSGFMLSKSENKLLFSSEYI